ncbi:MAG: hypothetical protein AB4290_09015 [Spirulina sp.]
MTIVQSDRGRDRFATKIRKWLNAVKTLRNRDLDWALPVTRLTSIKSLCQDENAARAFALHISQRVLQQMKNSDLPENSSFREWQKYQTFAIAIVDAIKTRENVKVLQKHLEKLAVSLGQNPGEVSWTTIRVLRREYLLKLEYALRCCTEGDREIWAYKLAREYVECYSPAYGTGLVPDSIPFLLDIAEFWCRYYFNLSLSEKFSKIMAQIEGISLNC